MDILKKKGKVVRAAFARLCGTLEEVAFLVWNSVDFVTTGDVCLMFMLHGTVAL